MCSSDLGAGATATPERALDHREWWYEFWCVNKLVAQRVTGDTMWARPALHHRKGRSAAEASARLQELVDGDEQLHGRS